MRAGNRWSSIDLSGNREASRARLRQRLPILVSLGLGIVALLSGTSEFARADGPTTVTFSYTGAAQTWTVPTGVTSVQSSVPVCGVRAG